MELVWRPGGVVLEDARVGPIERRRCGFRVRNGIGCGGSLVELRSEINAVDGMLQVAGVDCAGDGILKGQGCLGSALPEAGEEHEEEAELGEQEGGPDPRLRKHVHRSVRSEDDSGESDDGEEEKDGPGLREVCPQGPPGRGDGAEYAAIRLVVGTETQTELNGVDLDEIEVETEDGSNEEENDVAGEDCEEGLASDDVFIDVIGPFALKEEERAEDEGGDDKREDGDADETPEVEDALLKERAEAGWGSSLIAEEGSGYEEEVDEEIEGD